MLQAALRRHRAQRVRGLHRRLPHSRRYGVRGVGRVLEGLEQFRFTDEQLPAGHQRGGRRHRAAYLENFRFTGQDPRLREGETYFPTSRC
ncbi:hypothetical protein QJS66_00415 [Kocuria rhizophila]|nr:hypothetical protein QJS66_00415 [Kocuria rhizophila]